MAARLVVLGAKVFSQVKLICETCGVSPLEEILETRLIERVNKYCNEESAQKGMRYCIEFI